MTWSINNLLIVEHQKKINEIYSFAEKKKVHVCMLDSYMSDYLFESGVLFDTESQLLTTNQIKQIMLLCLNCLAADS